MPARGIRGCGQPCVRAHSLCACAAFAATKVPALPEQFSRGREAGLRNLRVAKAGLSFDEGTREEPVKSTCPECRRRCVQAAASFRGCLGNTSSARQPPFGVQACLRKDKPEGYGAATRPKGGCRARCADIPGASVSSPLRAEHVLSLSKPLQRLVCRGRGFPSVGLPTGSVGRGRA
jgi:hypothetical protein